MTPLTSELCSRILAQNAMQRGIVQGVASADPRELVDLERYLEHATERGTSLDELVLSYDLIVKDTLREQVFFRKNGRYRHASFADVAESVYFNDAYMSRYMHGLAITAFLWPNHAALRRFFGEFLERARTAPREPGHTRKYLEVGPGHGFYFMAAMRAGICDTYEGVDLSPTSVALTRELLESARFGSFSDHRVHACDFLAMSPPEPYDVIVMGEVLEHVERPDRFLERARSLMRPGASFYFTTCINSPALDHITLFESVESVERLAEDAGLAVQDRLVLPYAGTTLDRSVRERLPVNIALIATVGTR